MLKYGQYLVNHGLILLVRNVLLFCLINDHRPLVITINRLKLTADVLLFWKHVSV